jgi:hypothetical protein
MLPEFDLSGFEEIWKNNKEEKYKVGEIVRYIGNNNHILFDSYKGKTFEVRAANRQDEDSVEYLLAGFPYLVYEEEIEKV